MSKTREVYPSVAELRRWLTDYGVPDCWSIRLCDDGIRFFNPFDDMFSAVFSLVPEDEEVD